MDSYPELQYHYPGNSKAINYFINTESSVRDGKYSLSTFPVILGVLIQIKPLACQLPPFLFLGHMPGTEESNQ